jgi:hypothetical protein
LLVYSSYNEIYNYLLIKSPTTRVALPIRRAEAVETSAAQAALYQPADIPAL